MITLVTEMDRAIHVPDEAVTHEGFRRWVTSEAFLTQDRPPRVTFIEGEVYLDVSPESIFRHNVIKSEISRVLANLIKAEDLGLFFSDRTLLTHAEAELSTEPDAMFASYGAFEQGRARVLERDNDPQRDLELVGSPDWVLEVVSPSSRRKDKRQLPPKYFQAGVGEYWVVDALGETLDFQVFARGESGFKPGSQHGAWRRSEVFARWFQLRRDRNRLGHWQYTLDAAAGPGGQ